MALAEKIKGSNAVVVAFFGDGALGEGVLYEALNLASLWSAPILFVLENNRIAQTTPIELNLAGEIIDRFTAFGIHAQQLETSDVIAIHSAASQAITEVRQNSTTQALILNTHRFGPHSKGDDTRPREVLLSIRKSYDPLEIHSPRVNPKDLNSIEEVVAGEVSKAFQKALADPYPTE
jgi:TPP-dependent pyruvate/acetoin dehydrogenase alpha subunit